MALGGWLTSDTQVNTGRREHLTQRGEVLRLCLEASLGFISSPLVTLALELGTFAEWQGEEVQIGWQVPGVPSSELQERLTARVGVGIK